MCEWCEAQYNGDNYYIQDGGLPMQIYNGSILGVFDKNGNLISYAEIERCPKCGRELF